MSEKGTLNYTAIRRSPSAFHIFTPPAKQFSKKNYVELKHRPAGDWDGKVEVLPSPRAVVRPPHKA